MMKYKITMTLETDTNLSELVNDVKTFLENNIEQGIEHGISWYSEEEPATGYYSGVTIDSVEKIE
jgi:hypothetical protein